MVVQGSLIGIRPCRADIQRSHMDIQHSQADILSSCAPIQSIRAAILGKKSVRELIKKGILDSPSPISPCQEIGVSGQ
jgi:hypothetical protein